MNSLVPFGIILYVTNFCIEKNVCNGKILVEKYWVRFIDSAIDVAERLWLH